jgi:RNA polymerase sigma factor (sigma-70 family)
MEITELTLKKLRVIGRGITRGNIALADDILSGSLLYFYENFDKLQDHPNKIAYLIQKMKSLNIDHFRKDSRYRPEDTNQIFVDRNLDSIEEKIDIKQKKIQLREFINKMDEKCSEILWMWIVNLYTTKVMAEILNINQNTALTRIHNCRKKLFPLFEND